MVIAREPLTGIELATRFTTMAGRPAGPDSRSENKENSND